MIIAWHGLLVSPQVRGGEGDYAAGCRGVRDPGRRSEATEVAAIRKRREVSSPVPELWFVLRGGNASVLPFDTLKKNGWGSIMDSGAGGSVSGDSHSVGAGIRRGAGGGTTAGVPHAYPGGRAGCRDGLHHRGAPGGGAGLAQGSCPQCGAAGPADLAGHSFGDDAPQGGGRAGGQGGVGSFDHLLLGVLAARGQAQGTARRQVCLGVRIRCWGAG